MLWLPTIAFLPSRQEPPLVQARRIEAVLRVDGALDEPEWAEAGRIGALTQVEPHEGAPPSADTEILILYSKTTLYLGFRCREPRPRGLVLQQMRRDGAVRADDRVEWILDTFCDGRSAYRFQLTASGGRSDALIGNNGLERNQRWDGHWQARTRLDAEGWTAEAAIPFAALAFAPGRDWGFNVERFRGQLRERARWAGASRAYDLITVSAAGRLGGLEGLEQGLGLEWKPYGKLVHERDALAEDTRLFGRFGGDLTWRVLPQLSAGFTYRTDFAETEIDDLQVNLSRFPLFFPEKRDFFLEDAPLFEFGPLRATRESPDFLPYFSRSIGLLNGQEIPLDAGARLAGRAGPLELGVLAVQTREATIDVPGGLYTVPDRDLLVLRPALAVADGMRIGGLLTAGNPAADSSAQTLGGDFRWQRSDLFSGDGFFGLNLYAARSYDQAAGARDYAYGLQSRLQTDDWTVQYEGAAVGDEFRPALGFVRRAAFHAHRLSARYAPWLASGPARRLAFELEPSVYTSLGNELESYRVPLQFFGVELHSGDQLALAVIPEGDRPEAPFFPVPGSFIPAGEHDWVQGRIEASTAPKRPLSAAASFNAGSWYAGGSLAQWELSGEWRPSAHWRLALRYAQNHADIPGGDFTTRVEAANFDWLFTPDLYWENFVQSDNVSRSLGWQSRLRWIYQDGREAFLVFTSGWVDDFTTLAPTGRELTLKLVYALRF